VLIPQPSPGVDLAIVHASSSSPVIRPGWPVSFQKVSPDSMFFTSSPTCLRFGLENSLSFIDLCVAQMETFPAILETSIPAIPENSALQT